MDGTPTVSYEYENAAIANSKGKLTKVSSSVSTTEYTSFDILGKVTGHKQTTDNQPYTTAYSYNLSGGLVEETYPSGRVVKSTLDGAGQLTDISSKSGGSTNYHTYANSFTYTASGAVSSMRMGNGRWESAVFNSRLQVTQIALGTSQGATNLLKLNYDYGEIDANGNLDVNKNNGNIARQTTNFTELANPFIQSYKYDSLSRLSEAKEMNGTTQTWIQNFGYDPYGNRTSFNQQKIGEPAITQTPSVDPATNRFTTGQGFVYDLNGNIITDTQGRQFVFNGDNKQKEVRDVNNNVVGTYFYDGGGNRVKKVSSSDTTVFVYDASGQLVAEYSQQIAASPTISYLTNDSLGSPRVISDNSGAVVSRRDFMPFGEELYAGTANRIEAAKYSVTGMDNVRKRFTGYEKDNETGLDFAEARYYDNRYGRFTAIDPLLASGQSADPQSFNRYAYVSNDPINSTDPTGMWETGRTARDFEALSSTHVNKNGVVIAIFDDNDKGVYKHDNVETWSPGDAVLPKDGKGVTKIGETNSIGEFADHDRQGRYTVWTSDRHVNIAPGARIDFNANFDTYFDATVGSWSGNSLVSLAWYGQNGKALDIKNGRPNVGGKFQGKYITYRALGNHLFGYLVGLNGGISSDDFMKVAGEYDASGFSSAFWVAMGATPTINRAPNYGESAFSGHYLRAGFLWGSTAGRARQTQNQLRYYSSPTYRPRVGFSPPPR